MSAETTPSVERDRALDGLRGVAIVMVVLYHFSYFHRSLGPVGDALHTLTAMGWAGVDLFFVLSGFLITSILRRNREADRYFRPFFARRLLRILPLYYAVLVLALVVLPQVDAFRGALWEPGAEAQSAWYWLYASNLHTALTDRFHHNLLGLTWTLAIEAQFYALWPFVVLACSVPALRRTCWALIIGAVLVRVVAVAMGAGPVTIQTFTLARVDTLAAGSLLALAMTDPTETRRLRDFARWALPAAGLAYFGLVLAARLAPQLLDMWGGIADAHAPGAVRYSLHPIHSVVGYSLLVVFGAALLVRVRTATADSRLRRFFESRPLVSTGRYSYAIYLLHPIAGVLVDRLFHPIGPDTSLLGVQVLRWIASLALSYGLAWVSWHVLEGPLLRFQRYFPFRGVTR